MAPRRSRKPKHEPEVAAARKVALKKVVIPKRKTGRPSLFTQELADFICAELATGKSLSSVCRADGMPHLDTIWRWIREKPEFRAMYDRAKEESADALVESMLDIADDARNDWMEQFDAEGQSIGWKLNGEHVQRSRLRLDVRKWAASKLKPKKYGERVDMNHGVQPDDPIAALLKSIQGASFGPIPTHCIEHEDDEDAKSA